MTNHKSPLKRARQSEQRRLRNRMRKTSMKGVIKAVQQAVSAHSPELAAEKLKEAISEIDKTAARGGIHKNKAAEDL